MARKRVKPIIVLDPGHGGKDTGYINEEYGLIEKDFALGVVKTIQKHLPSHYTVYTTREDDRDVSLRDRVHLANKVKANVFVSIHLNSFKRKNANGFMLFYCDGFDRSRVLGTKISYQLRQLKHKYPHYRLQGNYPDTSYELIYTQMPSVIIEAGYITGDKDAPWLSHRKNWELIGYYIARGIQRYIDWEVKEYGDLYYSD